MLINEYEIKKTHSCYYEVNFTTHQKGQTSKRSRIQKGPEQGPPGNDDVGQPEQALAGEEIQDSQEEEDEPEIPLDGDRDAPLIILQAGEGPDVQEME